MHYLITGGTGFIGQALVAHLIKQDHNITILSRQPSNVKPPCRGVADLSELPDDTVIDIVINLAGSAIDRYWRESVKRDLFESRLNVSRSVIDLLARLTQKPALLISASAIGFYGPQDEIELSEQSHSIDCFTHDLCQAWETEANRASDFGVRVCIARFGVVLGRNGGMIKKLYLPFFWGLGGKLGSGDQVLSWIHIDDVIHGIHHLTQNKQANGIYNFTAPQPISNAVFTQAMGKALHRPTWFTVPSFVVKRLWGDMGETLLLQGQYVMPVNLLSEHFVFQYATIDDALGEIFK